MSLFCLKHRHLDYMDIRDFQQCEDCLGREREWYRVAEETARQIDRYRRG